MINIKKTIFLTGAGFSKNFGGYLSKEIWSKIFNAPSLNIHPAIKEKLKSNFDFESVYADVLSDSTISLDGKEEFQKIIIKAYVDMDDMLGQYTSNRDDPYQINFHGVRELLGLFSGSNNEAGLHFTLNQDLFMERHLGRSALGLGLNQYKEYIESISAKRINSNVSVQLPEQAFIDEFEEKHLSSSGDLFYIKLHGSLGWYSASGATKMVLGNNKLADILKEPLLKWYLSIFKEALFRDGVKLFILGYGFNDSHINKSIAKAIKDHGLKVYMISPTDPESFKYKLINQPFSNESTLRKLDKVGQTIWSGISSFFPYSLKEIFPSDQSETDKKKDLFNLIQE